MPAMVFGSSQTWTCEMPMSAYWRSVGGDLLGDFPRSAQSTSVDGACGPTAILSAAVRANVAGSRPTSRQAASTVARIASRSSSRLLNVLNQTFH